MNAARNVLAAQGANQVFEQQERTLYHKEETHLRHEHSNLVHIRLRVRGL